jgi:basic amino acid/polyamine antiporter, APA family
VAGNGNLIRAAGRWDLTALAINGLIGSAIFGLPAGVAQLAGSSGVLACLLCGGIVSLIVLCFSEASSLFAGTGGPYLYAREAFGRSLGFTGGWMMYLARVSAFAANINLLVSYLGYFQPSFRQTLPRMATMVIVTSLFCGINIRGIRQGALVGDLLAAAKMLPLLAFVAAGLYTLDLSLLKSADALPHTDFGQAVLLYVFAFTGFEYAAIPAGEALHPRKHLPFAMLTALGTACILYAGIQVVCQGQLPQLARSQTAMADAAGIFLGPFGGSLIAATAIVSILGNLSAMVLISPRLTFALAEDRLLPAKAAKLHPKYSTPHISILLYGALTLGLALSGTFVGLVRISAVARVIPYALTCLAVPRLRVLFPDAPDRFRLIGGGVIPVMAAVLCGWLLWQSRPGDILAAVAALFLGYAIWAGTAFAGSYRKKSRPGGNATGGDTSQV